MPGYGWHYGPCGSGGSVAPLVIMGFGAWLAFHSKTVIHALDVLLICAAISVGVLAVSTVVGLVIVIRREFRPVTREPYRAPIRAEAEVISITDALPGRPAVAPRATAGELAPPRPSYAADPYRRRPAARCRHQSPR